MRVLTVDDQAVFRRTAHRLVAATPGFEPVAEASSGAEALRLVDELRPDLVLLDVRMPGMDGVETARLLRQVDPNVIVVLISATEMPDDADRADAADRLRKQDLSPRTLREVWSAHGGD